MPFLRHWLPRHKSFLSNELEKCHPASELMKPSKGGRVCVWGCKRVHHTPLTHFFLFKCTLQMSATSAAREKRGRGKTASQEKSETKPEFGFRLQPRVQAICLRLPVLFEILASLLPNRTVIDTPTPSPPAIDTPLPRLPAHIHQQLLHL